MKHVKDLIKKYGELIRYGIFGVLTTVINIAIYEFGYKILGIGNVPGNILAWVISVLFAFVTNKLWVFDSKAREYAVVVREMTSFFGCRLATGLLDLAIMYVTVDLLQLSGTLMKCISNGIVILVNYVASKLLIFRDRDAKG